MFNKYQSRSGLKDIQSSKTYPRYTYNTSPSSESKHESCHLSEILGAVSHAIPKAGRDTPVIQTGQNKGASPTSGPRIFTCSIYMKLKLVASKLQKAFSTHNVGL